MPSSAAELREADLADWPFWYRVQNPGVFGAKHPQAQSRASIGRDLAVTRNRLGGAVGSARRAGKGRRAAYEDVERGQGRCDEGMRQLERLRIAGMSRAELRRHGAGPREAVSDVLGRVQGGLIDRVVERETRRWESDENEDEHEIGKEDVQGEERPERSKSKDTDMEKRGVKEGGPLVDV